MTGLRLYLLYGALLFSAGCSPAPVIVTTYDAATLESLVGKKVILEGRVELHKAGYVLKTSAPPIVLEYFGAQDASWPEVGTRVQVTGTLRASQGTRGEYPFRLEHPRSTLLENPAP
jgi:hypothetical protein